jgi:hypothetical protein
MIRFIRRFTDALNFAAKAQRHIDALKINQGIILSELQKLKSEDALSDYEFKVFSQWGEDGIIQFLTQNLKIENKTFIEFGVEDFAESNCRFLLMKDLWEGFVIDGSPQNIRRLQNFYFYWMYPISAISAFIDRENICDLLRKSGFAKNVGIFSIDIDGVDYYVLESALTEWHPNIIIVEYNGVFGRSNNVSVPYDPAFVRSSAHFSNVYYGASLGAYTTMLGDKGYGLVGINKIGSNAFFVRRDLLNDKIREVSVDETFRSSLFRETRDEFGKLSLIGKDDRRSVIAHMPVYDVITGQTGKVSDLGD